MVNQNSLGIVRLVQRPLQVETVTGGDAQVHLHSQERLGKVFLGGLPSNAIDGGGHLCPQTRQSERARERGERGGGGAET